MNNNTIGKIEYATEVGQAYLETNFIEKDECTSFFDIKIEYKKIVDKIVDLFKGVIDWEKEDYEVLCDLMYRLKQYEYNNITCENLLNNRKEELLAKYRDDYDMNYYMTKFYDKDNAYDILKEIYNRDEDSEIGFYYDDDDNVRWVIDRACLGFVFTSNEKVSKFLSICKDQNEIDKLIEIYKLGFISLNPAYDVQDIRIATKDEEINIDTEQFDYSIFMIISDHSGDIFYSGGERNLFILARKLIAWAMFEMADKTIDNYLKVEA